MSPHTDQHRFVESYYRMLSDSDLNEFQKVLEMKVSLGIYCKSLKGWGWAKIRKTLKFCNLYNALISIIWFYKYCNKPLECSFFFLLANPWNKKKNKLFWSQIVGCMFLLLLSQTFHIFIFSWMNEPILTKFGTEHPWIKDLCLFKWMIRPSFKRR